MCTAKAVQGLLVACGGLQRTEAGGAVKTAPYARLVPLLDTDQNAACPCGEFPHRQAAFATGLVWSGGLGMLLGLQPVEVVEPVGFQEIDQEDHGADEPGQRIGGEDHLNFRDVVDDNRDIGDTNQAPGDQHGEHGDHGLASAPHDAGNAVGEGQEEIGEGLQFGLAGAEIHHLWGVVEKRDELGAKEIDGDTHQLRQDHGAADSEPDALLHPVILPGSQVLAHEGGQGHGEAGDGQKGKALHLGVGATASHGGVAKAVDVGLDHQVGKGDDGILHARGQAEADDIF